MTNEPRTTLSVEWLDSGLEPQCQPNPAYPDGCDVDCSGGALLACTAELPYPAPRIGAYVVRCSQCGHSVALTTAGRIDDPRALTLPCGAAIVNVTKAGNILPLNEQFVKITAH